MMFFKIILLVAFAFFSSLSLFAEENLIWIDYTFNTPKRIKTREPIFLTPHTHIGNASWRYKGYIKFDNNEVYVDWHNKYDSVPPLYGIIKQGNLYYFIIAGKSSIYDVKDKKMKDEKIYKIPNDVLIFLLNKLKDENYFSCVLYLFSGHLTENPYWTIALLDKYWAQTNLEAIEKCFSMNTFNVAFFEFLKKDLLKKKERDIIFKIYQDVLDKTLNSREIDFITQRSNFMAILLSLDYEKGRDALLKYKEKNQLRANDEVFLYGNYSATHLKKSTDELVDHMIDLYKSKN